MGFYKFIKIKGIEDANTGYFVPRMYKLPFMWSELKIVGLKFVKDRLAGWTIWWVESEEDFATAIKTLDELKKTRIFIKVASFSKIKRRFGLNAKSFLFSLFSFIFQRG